MHSGLSAVLSESRLVNYKPLDKSLSQRKPPGSSDEKHDAEFDVIQGQILNDFYGSCR